MRAAAILALAVLPIPSACGAEAAGSFALQAARVSAPVFVGTVTNPDIREASGMAASRLRSDLLWVINDGGNEEFLYAVGLDGSDLGKVRVENASNTETASSMNAGRRKTGPSRSHARRAWLVMPKLRQAEALCFSAGDDSLYVTSEKRPAPLYRIDLGR